MPTIEQIRAARALLGWSQSDLADHSGLSQTGIARIENGTNSPNTQTTAKILNAFDHADIEFIGENGVRKRTGEIRTMKGQEGFLRFYEDIYTTLDKKPGVVRLSNVDERLFEKWLGDNLEKHINRILQMKDVSYKILIKEDDRHFITSDFAEYRWTPAESFASVPFYVYGDKLGMILFDEEPTVIVLDYPRIANAHKKQFDSIWKTAKKVS